MSRIFPLAKRASEILGGVAGVAVFLLVILSQLRSCTVAAWMSGKDPENYSLIGRDGRVLSAFILPGNKVALWYANPANNEREAALALWRGTFGDHYGWGVWYMGEAPVPGPNWRIFPRGFEPVYMEMTWLEKFREGPGNPVFPNQGESTRGFVLIADDRSKIVFEKMILDKSDPNPLLATYLEDLFQDAGVDKALEGIGSEKIREIGRQLR